jgi:hypothetical protein
VDAVLVQELIEELPTYKAKSGKLSRGRESVCVRMRVRMFTCMLYVWARVRACCIVCVCAVRACGIAWDSTVALNAHSVSCLNM